MSRLEDLQEMRALLFDAVEDVELEKRASTIAELRRVVKELDELEASSSAGQKGTVLDELTARRAARRTGTAG